MFSYKIKLKQGYAGVLGGGWGGGGGGEFTL